MNPLILSRIISGWIFFIVVCIANINKNNTDDPFYRWGPHPDLIIFGIVIDTWTKYFYIILYSLINTTLRNVDKNILNPYITLHIQDDSPDAIIRKKSMNRAHAYEIVMLTTIYNWFDWFMYVQMLFVQVDMIMIEASTDLVVSLVITRWYLKEAEDSFPYMNFA
jgi:hypothetical protein